jgi:hypothetical protein
LFTDEFLKMIREPGVVSVKLPARSPNLNAGLLNYYYRSAA